MTGARARPAGSGRRVACGLALALAAATASHAAPAPVTESDIRAVYDRLAAQPRPTEYKVRHILVASPEKAQAALVRLDGGESFASVARSLSIDEGSATKDGGELGWNLPASFVQEFSSAMVALAPHGRSTTPVRTRFGWHIIEVTDVRPKAFASLDTLHDRIATDLARVRAMADQARTITYSDNERARLGYCAAMTDNALSIANRRRAGQSIAQARQAYAAVPEPSATALRALVDKVYGDTVVNDWDYANQFFLDCTHNLTPVPRERVGRAAWCMQNRMVGAVTSQVKASGAPIEVARAGFAYYDAPETQAIIDDVYAHPKSLQQAESEAWDRCIGDVAP
jgi:hypothetical protein